MKRQHLRIVQDNLYHMLQQYTKGSTNERVVTATRDMSLDQYRIMYFEGMHVSEHALFLANGRVWRVAEVKKAADFAQTVDAWEQDRDFLLRHVKYSMPVPDQQYALLNICPADLRREVLREYTADKFPSYLSLKQHIQNLITRDRDIQSQAAGRGINEVEKPPKNRKKSEEDEWGQQVWGDEAGWEGQGQEQWDGTWVDEQGFQYVGALKGSKGKGKGKGKKGGGGKKGKGKGKGCAICGQEDHWQKRVPNESPE